MWFTEVHETQFAAKIIHLEISEQKWMAHWADQCKTSSTDVSAEDENCKKSQKCVQTQLCKHPKCIWKYIWLLCLRPFRQAKMFLKVVSWLRQSWVSKRIILNRKLKDSNLFSCSDFQKMLPTEGCDSESSLWPLNDQKWERCHGWVAVTSLTRGFEINDLCYVVVQISNLNCPLILY